MWPLDLARAARRVSAGEANIPTTEYGIRFYGLEGNYCFFGIQNVPLLRIFGYLPKPLPQTY